MCVHTHTQRRRWICIFPDFSPNHDAADIINKPQGTGIRLHCKSAATRKQTPGKPNSQTNRKQTNNRMKRKNERQTTGVEVEGIINAYEKIPKRQTNCKFSVAFPQNVTEIIRCRQRSKVCSTKAGAVRLGLPFATPS